MATRKSKEAVSKRPTKGGCTVEITIHVSRSRAAGSPKVNVRMSESPSSAKKMLSASAPPSMTVLSGGPGGGGSGGGGGEPLVSIYIDINA